MKRAAVLLCVLLLAALAGGALWVHRALDQPMRLPPEGALVRIRAGMSLRQAATRLEEAGVIRHAPLLLGLARWEGGDRQVRAGEYRFEGSPTLREVLARLRAPAANERRVTIPEGRTAREIFALLEAAGLGGADVFACIAESPTWLLANDLPATGVEGYLFPDTYGFDADGDPAEILAAMVARYRAQTAPLREARQTSGMSEHEMVTLASLIEKETGSPAERPLIAAVFRNRLRLGMPLQADPTVVYEREDATPRPITRAELLDPGDYNTYQRRGLPPGPIANPGLASLTASVRPATSDFLYFVARNDGTHEFSRNLDEHNRAVQRYRRSSRGS